MNKSMMGLAHELARILILLVLNQDIDIEEMVFPEEEKGTDLFSMLEAGNINEAECLLTKGLEPENQTHFGRALLFYDKLSGKPEAFLEAHDYSQEKILEGLKRVVEYYKFGSLMEAFMET